MKGLIKKSLMIGMGALSLTREKAEKIVRELEEKGEVTSDEAKQFINELEERGEQERSAVKKVVATELERLKNITGIITKKDLSILEERLRKVEQSAGLTVTESNENNQPQVESSPPK